ncbi:hypothetical protein M747DRAFT_85674 [Aspergillus niger ATCC 13496]|uniref:Uncharacterized protein n=1 Tax=Aspergillus niger ATCC 13496 TaxID=1353008 RepID=A0A370BQZ5_ASPNG|nr:hypothetical protein M747DRAFT_85674 [Aspergillus niger ATCC 13496]
MINDDTVYGECKSDQVCLSVSGHMWVDHLGGGLFPSLLFCSFLPSFLFFFFSPFLFFFGPIASGSIMLKKNGTLARGIRLPGTLWPIQRK